MKKLLIFLFSISTGSLYSSEGQPPTQGARPDGLGITRTEVIKRRFEEDLRKLEEKIKTNTLTMKDVAPLRVETILAGDWRIPILEEFMEQYKDELYKKAEAQKKQPLQFEDLENTFACLHLISYGCKDAEKAMALSRALVASRFVLFIQSTGSEEITQFVPALYIIDNNSVETKGTGFIYPPHLQAYFSNGQNGAQKLLGDCRAEQVNELTRGRSSHSQKYHSMHFYFKKYGNLPQEISYETALNQLSEFLDHFYAPTFWPDVKTLAHDTINWATRWDSSIENKDPDLQLKKFELILTQFLLILRLEKNAETVRTAQELYEQVLTKTEPALYKLIEDTIADNLPTESEITGANRALYLLEHVYGKESLPAGYLEMKKAALAKQSEETNKIRDQYSSFVSAFDCGSLSIDTCIELKKKTSSSEAALFFCKSYDTWIKEIANNRKAETSCARLENACAALWLLEECAKMSKKDDCAREARDLINQLWSKEIAAPYVEKAETSEVLEDMQTGLQALLLTETICPEDVAQQYVRGKKPLLETKVTAAQAKIARQKQEEKERKEREEQDRKKKAGEGEKKPKASPTDNGNGTNTPSLLSRLLSNKRVLLIGGITLAAAISSALGAVAYQKYGTKKPQPKAKT
jgi:hypothetical protein